ncbi:MAG: methyltransferase domain-containing protein [Pseudomonadota bacterium]
MTRMQKQFELQNTLYTSSNPTRRYLHCARRDWVLAEVAGTPVADIAAEIGPGSGVYLQALRAKCHQLLVVDQESAFLCGSATETAVQSPANEIADANPACVGKESGARLGSNDSGTVYLLGALPKLPLADRSVDLLLCSEVVEHIPDIRSQLAELARILKPGGRLVLTTPQPASPLEMLGRVAFLPGVIQLLRLIYREPIEPTGHINVVSRATVEHVFEEVGLVVRRRSAMGFYLPIIGEFGGHLGRRVLEWCDTRLQESPLAFLLWSQCYVLELSSEGRGRTGKTL